MEITVAYAEQSDLFDVWRLTYWEYLRMGYIDPNPRETFSEYEHLELGGPAPTTVFVALFNGDIIGTVSVTRDSDCKLHTDVDFGKATGIVRASGVSLASVWRIVTQWQYRGNAAVVSALMRAVVKWCGEWGIETLLCTFNPRHEKVYERLFKAVTIDSRNATIGLKRAPAVLMRLDLSKFPSRWFEGATP